MTHDSLRDTTLIRAATDLLTDVSDLVRKELRLARAEVSQKVSERLHGLCWIAAAGGLAAVAFLLVVAAAVFALASTGLAPHWSCLIVAGILAVAGAIAFFTGRTSLASDISPTRTTRQFNEAVRTATEQLR